MKGFIALLLLLSVPAVGLDDSDTTEFQAQEISISDTVELMTHESILFGISCVSGPQTELHLDTVSVGDHISAGEYSFTVGVIDCQRWNRDVEIGKLLSVKKGQTSCSIAPSYAALPREDDCQALWIYVPNAKVIR